MPTGYKSPLYVQSLSEFGTPRELSRSKAWILQRGISGFPYQDAMGCYPLFACRDWSQLHTDLEDLNGEVISLSVVTDPFGDYDEIYLRRCFNALVTPFKEHFVIKLGPPLESFVSSHHRRNARKGLKNVDVEKCEVPSNFIDDWISLYANLIKRLNLKGITKFSRTSFESQLRVPGITAFRAMYKDSTVGMLLWYVQDEVGYYHLGTCSDQGYELRASFALFWTAIKYFADIDINWLNLGAGAGVKNGGTDGLSRFKRGWSTGTRTVYFCGRVFDHAKYSEIIKERGIFATDYFPAYRNGEFG